MLEIRGADFETVYTGQSTRHTDDERLRRTLDVGINSLAHLGQLNHKLCSSMNAYAKLKMKTLFFYKIGVNLIEVLSTGHTNMLG